LCDAARYFRNAVLSKVKQFYGKIERKSLPPRPEIKLPPVKSESFTLGSNLPYLLAFIAYRMPGTDSRDFAAVQILCDILSSQRASLYALVPQGKALGTEFGLAETYPKASVAYSAAALPADGDSAAVIQEMGGILADYAKDGVPEDLVEAAKRREIVGAEFRRNSIPGLADAWSEALAGEGRNSPDEDIEAMKRVTLQDVNRVAKPVSPRSELHHGRAKAGAVGCRRRFQRIWRKRTVDFGPCETCGIACLGIV
jgi:zinc protease